MTGDYDSVIGMLKDSSIPRFTQVGITRKIWPSRWVKQRFVRLFVESNRHGLATRAEPVRVGGRLQERFDLPLPRRY